LYGDQPPSRFYRYDDPQVTLRSGGKTHVDKSLRDSLPVSERPAHVGCWQYTVAGAPGGVARRSDQAGDEASVDFVGDSIALLHKEGRLERTLLLSAEAEQLYGLAAVTLDGQPVELGGPITQDAEGNAVIDTSRNARVVLARGLTPGPHRLTVTNLGRPSHPGGSTAVAVLGFFAGVESGPTPWSQRAWRYALAVRGGKAWQEQAARLAAAANDEAGVKAVEQLYFASREVDVVAARLRALHDRPPPSAMVQRERQIWRPQSDTLAYFAQLAELKSRATAALAQADEFCYDPRQPSEFTEFLGDLQRLAADMDACLTAQVRQLPPIIFCQWGCSIRIINPRLPDDPERCGRSPDERCGRSPDRATEPTAGLLDSRRPAVGSSGGVGDPRRAPPAKVLFQDPKAIIFDLTLSYDASTVFFSMRRDGQQYWQIYEMGIDGQNLKQITDGDFYNVCPVPLPDGRLAFLSSRTPGSHTVCQSGPSLHVHVMNRDGSGAQDLSTNTLTDFGLSQMSDGRLLFTRWEYVDSDLGWRQSLWTLYPDGRQFGLYFGNTIVDPATFWQAREIPGRDAVVCTLAPHHGTPYGAIGIVSRRFGLEAPRDEGFRWITEEFPVIEDLNWFWAYRDPYPVSESQFLVSYGGGGLQRFRLFLLDEMDNRVLVYDDPATSCFYPQPVRARVQPAHLPTDSSESVRFVEVPAAPPGQPEPERVATGRFFVTDVYRGLEPDVARGRAKSIRIMEQLPKTVNTTWYRVYDQGPLMSGGTTYYAKRCWGYAPVEEDGSAWFEAPAGKEIYFQVCDAEGRELQRMTSATQLMPGEVQGCIGCHESRDAAQPNRGPALALRRAASPLQWPEWGHAGVIDYVRVVQPILD
ncbi:MAG: hypothetical protein MUF25_29120, partial [Pirellulaceae bacterium]|nr:hypothetical protein [Pirellulaceae bacterium]